MKMLILCLCLLIFHGSTHGEELQCIGHVVLNDYERFQFVDVAIGQRSQVHAEFLSEPGCGRQMIDALGGLGATIDFADKNVGYALVTVARGKLLDAIDLAGIAYAYTSDGDWYYNFADWLYFLQNPTAQVPPSKRKDEPGQMPAIAIPYQRVATALRPDGPYFAAHEIGLDTLWQHHSAADGRGVRVAVPDEGFDLLHPALQQARDAAGSIVPKIADLETSTLPAEDSGWVRFSDPITTANGNFYAAGRTWTVPVDGTYRFGIFRAELLLGPSGNSKSKRVPIAVGVLWDQRSNRVWVDVDGDGNFRNQRPLGDYSVKHDISWFGTKEVGKDNRIPFGVKIDQIQNTVYVRIGRMHGAYVGGALAGNKLTGGLFDGAAPSAQLIDSNYDPVTYLTSIVKMFARPDVDLINRSGGIGEQGQQGNVGHPVGFQDFEQHVVERLIALYGKPMAAVSAAFGTINVFDYAGPEMLRRNRQLGPPYRDSINGFVWDMPNGFVNTVLAPSANLETESRYMPADILWGDGKKHSFSDNSFDPPAPDGYAIGSNNSPTIAVVSGILADLISEAKREHIRYNALRLDNAIFTGTRLLAGFPLSQQGYGLVNAEQSWCQLAKMAKVDDPTNSELTSFTVARMENGRSIDVQGFHADLSSPGEKLEGEVWITRRGGYAGGRKYTFSLRGNNGSYELLDHEAMLERDKPVRVRFRTNGASGRNIVFLDLRDAVEDVVMDDVALSVRVPDVPQNIAPGVERYESTIEPLRSESRYVRLGNDVQAARYVMRIPYTGRQYFNAREFPGSDYQTQTTPPGEAVDGAHHVGPMETLESLVVNDTPGTKEILWENRGRSEYATQYDGPAPDVAIHATLTVTKYAVAITKTQPQTLSVVNELAEVKGHVELYDAFLSTSEMHGQGKHAMAEVERNVPANLAEWRLRVSGRPEGTHTDAYVFNCTGKDGCASVMQQAITDKGALLIVEKPQAGAWKIIVRTREQVTGNSVYKLSEAELLPTPGEVTETDTKHASGEKWTVTLPGTTQYAAFRIAGTPGLEREKEGLLIAMTPLKANAP
jgi:hypothetical protein